jgi:uncharacterized membrane protein
LEQSQKSAKGQADPTPADGANSGNKEPDEPNDDEDEESLEGEIVPLSPTSERQLAKAGADPHDPGVRRAFLIGKRTSFQGPIPPPELLKQYGDIIPDLPNRIVHWYEDQAGHRKSIELEESRGSQRRMDRGQTFTFMLAALGMVMSALVGIFGSWVVGSVLGLVSVGGPTAAFILARSFNWGNPASQHTNNDAKETDNAAKVAKKALSNESGSVDTDSPTEE